MYREYFFVEKNYLEKNLASNVNKRTFQIILLSLKLTIKKKSYAIMILT